MRFKRILFALVLVTGLFLTSWSGEQGEPNQTNSCGATTICGYWCGAEGFSTRCVSEGFWAHCTGYNQWGGITMQSIVGCPL